jgi:2,3-bisphosphoglycerate-dependent phosphoglycerate mutase
MNEADNSSGRRQRRRQRRRVAIAGFVVFAIGMAWFFELQATTTVIVARYADKVELGGSDPGLSAQGQRRAEDLARLIANVDVVAGIDAIFVAPNRRSRDTALPLAMRNEAPVHTIEDPADVKMLVKRILSEFKGKIVLVVTEPEYMQPLIREMHGSKKLPPSEEAGYENLYIVTIPWFGNVKTLRLHFGAMDFVPTPLISQ